MKDMNKRNTIYGLQIDGGYHHDCQDEVARVLPPRLRELIRTKFASVWERRPHLLHLAITEAVALAERTGLPQLFLPALALEKVEAAAAWHLRQRNTFLARGGFRAIPTRTY
jgi:hypothetical protein